MKGEVLDLDEYTTRQCDVVYLLGNSQMDNLCALERRDG